MIMVVLLPAVTFLELGLKSVGFHLARQQRNGYAGNLRHFHSSYGASPVVYSAIYSDLQTTMIAVAHMDMPDPCHFLIPMYWMFICATEIQLAGKFGKSEKTARVHIWKCIKAVQALKAQKVSNNGGPWVLASTSLLQHISYATHFPRPYSFLLLDCLAMG
jgi:hypothetical protein